MKRLLLLSLLVFAVAAFGQDAPAEEMAMEETMMDSAAMDMAADTTMMDSMAMDMLMTDTTEVAEEAMEDEGDALEAMLAEEGTEMVAATGSQSAGYTIGAMVAYPIGLGSLSDNEASPVFGVVGSTPFGFAVGPFEMGLGFEASYYTFGTQAEGPSILATVNTAVLETPQGPVAVELGAGWYGGGPGATAGLTYGYSIPNVPVVIKPFARASLVMDLDLAEIEGNDGLMMWVNVGLYASYDLGDLF